MRTKLYLSLFFLALAFLIPNVALVYGEDEGTDLDLSNFPEALADKFNISVFAGGILASVLLMVMFMMPVALWSRTIIPPLFVGVLTLGFAIGVGWLDYWFLLVLCLMVALMFASKIRTVIGGK